MKNPKRNFPNATILILLPLIFLSQTSLAEVVLDTSLIKPFSKALMKEVQKCSPAPFTVNYKKNGKELTLIASGHDVATYSHVEAAIRVQEPNAIVVEGFQSSEGLSVRQVSQELKDACKKSDYMKCDENQYAQTLAQAQKIPSIGGELSREEIIESLKPDYSERDEAAFNWIAYLGGANEQAEKDKIKFESSLSGKKLDGMKFEEFKDYFKLKIGAKFNILKVSMEDLSPDNSSTATYFQRFAFRRDIPREINVIKTIEKVFKENDRVMAVYGSGHFVKWNAVLESAFGKPTFFCEPIKRVNSTRVHGAKPSK